MHGNSYAEPDDEPVSLLDDEPPPSPPPLDEDEDPPDEDDSDEPEDDEELPPPSPLPLEDDSALPLLLDPLLPELPDPLLEDDDEHGTHASNPARQVVHCTIAPSAARTMTQANVPGAIRMSSTSPQYSGGSSGTIVRRERGMST